MPVSEVYGPERHLFRFCSTTDKLEFKIMFMKPVR